MTDALRKGTSYTSAYNLTGWPGVVVRGGTSPEGLPIGVQVIARPWREDVALAVAQLPILQERCGCKLNLMRFSDYGLSLMSNGLIASDKIIAENPDLVRRFTAATVEAIAAAVANRNFIALLV